MWTDEVLDKELVGDHETVTPPPKWVGIIWLILGLWLLSEGWNAHSMLYEYQHQNREFHLLQPYTSYINAYKLVLQGGFAIFLGIFHLKSVHKVQYYVVGYLLAGLAFHFINILINFKSSVLFIEEWASIALVGVSLWPAFKEHQGYAQPTLFVDTVLLLLAVGGAFYPELIERQPNLFMPKLIGLSCFCIFLLRTIPVYFPHFWHKSWYNYLYPFLGLAPYLLQVFL